MISRNEGALAHAWAYFQLHASQRITIFNYFVVFSGILATGLAAAIQAPPRLASVGVALGLLLTLLSYLFWQLDRRTSFLVKHAEEVIKLREPADARLVNDEIDKTLDAKKNDGLWTYGEVFRVIFFVMALVGIGGAIVSGLRWAGFLSWDEAKTPQHITGTVGSDAPPPSGAAQRANDRGANFRYNMGKGGKIAHEPLPPNVVESTPSTTASAKKD